MRPPTTSPRRAALVEREKLERLNAELAEHAEKSLAFLLCGLRGLCVERDLSSLRTLQLTETDFDSWRALHAVNKLINLRTAIVIQR